MSAKDYRQRYIEAQAKNMYMVWKNAMDNCRPGPIGYYEWADWEGTSDDIKRVWYTVTAAAMGMHKF